ncbi:hypothetical protein ACFYO9_33505 [Streptomyces sp. NPDC005863]|uniref:hypothetical protein n=1 Tax=unclassified Streptomyces TaxID=2593676 RepID=UPI0033D76D28
MASASESSDAASVAPFTAVESLGQRDGSAISDWLARSLQEPAQAWREWAATGVALLPCGRRFDAVRLPERLVHSAVRSTDPKVVAARLTQSLDGPVIYDGRTMGGTYYTLTRRRRKGTWRHQDVAPWLGVDFYLGVPRLNRTEPPGTHWVVAPRFEGDLCEPLAVKALSRVGRTSEEAEPC